MMDEALILGAEARLDWSPWAAGASRVGSITDQLAARVGGTSAAMMTSLSSAGTTFTVVGSELAAWGDSLHRRGEAMTGMVGDWISAAGQFERDLRLLAVVAGTDEKTLDRLKEKAVEIGLTSMFSPGEATAAMRNLLAGGLSVEETMSAIVPTLNMVAASAGEIDLESGAKLAVIAMNKFKLTTKDLPSFFDEITVLAQRSNLGFQDMLGLMTSLNALPSLMTKTSKESFLAIVGAASGVGMSAEVAGQATQAIARGLNQLQRQVDKGKGRRLDYLQALGLNVTSLKDASGEWKDLADIIQIVNRAVESSPLTGPERSAALAGLFDQNAAGLIVSLGNLREQIDPLTGKVVKGVDALQSLRRVLGDDSTLGRAESAADSFLETWSGATKLWTSTKDTFKIVMGDTILPLVTKALLLFNSFMQGLLHLAKNNAIVRWSLLGIVLGMGLLLVVAGGLLVVLGTLAVAIGSLIALFVAFTFAETAVAMGAVLVEVVLWPLLLVTLALAAAMSMLTAQLIWFSLALYVLWTYDIAGFRTELLNLWDAIDVGRKSLDAFLAGKSIDEIMKEKLVGHGWMLMFVRFIVMLDYRWRKFTGGMRDGAKEARDALWEAVDGVRGALASVFGRPGEDGPFDHTMPLGDPKYWIATGRLIGYAISLAFWPLTDFLNKLTLGILIWKNWRLIVALVALEFFLLADQAYNAGSNFVKGFWDGMAAMWDQMIAWLSGKLDELWGMFPSWFAPEFPLPPGGAGGDPIAGAAGASTPVFGPPTRLPAPRAAPASTNSAAQGNRTVSIGNITLPVSQLPQGATLEELVQSLTERLTREIEKSLSAEVG